MCERRWTQGTQVLNKLHGCYDLLLQTAEIKTARIVESNSINHGGRLNTCMNITIFRYIPIEKYEKLLFELVNSYNPDETDSDFDDIISNSFEKLQIHTLLYAYYAMQRFVHVLYTYLLNRMTCVCHNFICLRSQNTCRYIIVY